MYGKLFAIKIHRKTFFDITKNSMFIFLKKNILELTFENMEGVINNGQSR